MHPLIPYPYGHLLFATGALAIIFGSIAWVTWGGVRVTGLVSFLVGVMYEDPNPSRDK